ncbi:TPA: restriction endonuclease subunit S [Escherichia coli]|nr:restriction endonuclease subunit S [Escherichia coli]HAW1058337.1 restriction endonuclease subunit S [Escherichia coli]HAW1145289.1 restriction endonuclease subunit S [Escherichia coli]HAW1337404.1 restriction endonuclease subunit S [Escherichia coli]HAW1571670.1 restriction endonuclease subunit S [Escherichia coli]
MSELSYLEKLLDGVEVEWRTLGEIAVIYDGTHKTPKYTASGVPFVSVQNIKNLYGTNKYISPEDFKTYKNKPRKHDLFMTRIGDVGTCAIVEDDRPLAYYVTLALIRINQQIAVPGFIRYLIESRFGKAELYKRTLIHAVPMKINLGEIGKVAVPIPCPDNPEKSLAIQSEIVRILDKFTALTAELTAELNMRKKQYNYYRDQLLSFKDGEVEWKTLGEVAQYSKTRISFELLDERNYVGVDNLLQNRAGKSLSNHVPTSGKLTEFIPNDILIGNIRPYLKKIWQADCIGGTNGDVLVIRCIDSSINTRYLYQILADDKFFEYNIQHAKGAKMPRGSKEDIMKYPIPVPPLTLQARIVEILNKFDTLTNSITEGLPREIELRQKQYEYYRDLLFSFPKPETVSN